MGYEPNVVGDAKNSKARAKLVIKALVGEAPPMVVTDETQPSLLKPKRKGRLSWWLKEAI